MKLKDEFISYDVEDTHVLVDIKGTFPGMVRSNKSAAFIISCLKQDTTREEVLAKLVDKYDASEELLSSDLDKVLLALRQIGALKE